MHLADSNLAIRILSRLTKLYPSAFWTHIDKKAGRLGLDRLYVILSFDCDTKNDIPAAENLYRRLHQLQLKPSFAVPGEQLKEGIDVYGALAERGVLFLNHGYRPHLVWQDEQFKSTTFYAKMSLEEIEEDIRRAHETVRLVTGREPRGFRTPHFGLFQRTDQVALIHKILKKMNYVFSSSTSPQYLLTHDMVWRDDGLCEIPHSGDFFSPLTVFDSYSYVPKDGKYKVDRNYGIRFAETIELLVKRGFRGVLNFYADPAHVVDSEDYDRALQTLVRNKVPTLDYEDLLKLMRFS